MSFFGDPGPWAPGMGPTRHPGPWRDRYQHPPQQGPGPYDGLSTAAWMFAITGAITSAIGSYYSAVGKKYELKSAASAAEHEAFMSDLNARMAEQDAQAILQAGQQEIGLLGLQTAQVKGAQRASTAAAGVVVGVGSAAEVQASTQLAHDIDAMTINVNSVRAAGAQRMAAVGFRNRGNLSRVSAQNLRRSARTIRPWVSAGTDLLGSASGISNQWLVGSESRRREG